MKFDSVTVSVVIPAVPDAVYKAWMSSAGHAVMTGNPATVSARIGGKFTAWDGYISGTTLELTPPSRILQAWRTTEFADDEEDSLLEVLLAEAKGGTKVTLKHTKIPAGQGPSYKQGWIDYYFEPMKEHFQKKP
jgi:uncharacterized protein YndB with AHSA1/START domain